MLNKTQAENVVNRVVEEHEAKCLAAGTSGPLYPVFCQLQADSAEQIGEWILASEWWRLASNCSLGWNRSQRYEEAARACDLKAEEVNHGA